MDNSTVACKVIISIRDFHLIDREKFTYYFLTITNNSALRNTFLENETFKKAIGDLLIDSIQKFSYAYIHVPKFQLQNYGDLEQALGFARTSIAFLHKYLMFLWFVRDNSAGFQQAISAFGVTPKQYFTTEFNYEVVTNSKGLFEASSFTFDDLMRTAEIYNQYLIITGRKGSVDASGNASNSIENNSDGNFIDVEDRDYSGMHVIERALTFIFAARATILLPNKLSFYMTALESIFVPEGGGELQQKIAERAAFYLGNTKNRVQIFTTIQNGYKVRSKYVHGDSLPALYRNIDSLRLLCLQIDAIARRVFTKVIMEDHAKFNDQKKLEKYLSELIFQ